MQKLNEEIEHVRVDKERAIREARTRFEEQIRHARENSDSERAALIQQAADARQDIARANERHRQQDERFTKERSAYEDKIREKDLLISVLQQQAQSLKEDGLRGFELEGKYS